MSPRVVSLVLLLLATPLLAAQGTPGAVPPVPTPALSDLGGSAVQMVFGLFVVLALLLGALWLLRRLGQPGGPAAGLMRVVAGVAIGPRERIVILELGDNWLVLGVAPGQITTLAEIPRQELPAGTPLPTAGEFPTWLRQMINRRGR